jgi:hypothetical protein
MNFAAPTYSSTVEICQNIDLGILTAPTIKLISNEKLFRAAIPALFTTALGFDYNKVINTPIAGTRSNSLQSCISLFMGDPRERLFAVGPI